ncbi:MAG: hypothetical protein K2I91_01890, partial [Muribaculaceae bacterium]|nr:hypothetical protein [Muribaculaceae bacterium]
TLRDGENGDGKKIDFDGPEAKKEKDRLTSETKAKLADVYGHDKLVEQIQASAKQKYIILKPNQLDNHEIIAILERTPAFNRNLGILDEIDRLSSAAAPVRNASQQGTVSGEEHTGRDSVISF